ncbi:MAG: DMT family transporter [Ruminococcaceae bacterium]|nr:DMT family transporter [Oscillospiraceae bacterium]
MKTETKDKLFLILSMVIFGTIGIFRKYIPLPSGTVATFRGFIGVLFLTIVFLIKKKKPDFSVIKSKLLLLITSGIFIGINWILLFESYNYTSVATATLCYYMAPVIVTLMSPLLLKERLSAVKIICVFLSLLGMAFVSGIFESTSSGNSDLKGILFGLGAAVFYASVILLNKKIGTVDSLDKTWVQLFFAAVILLPYIIAAETVSASDFTPTTVIMLLIVGMIHTGFAYTLYFGSVGKLPAQTVAIFGYIDPVLSVILSALILKENMTGLGIVGAVLILGSTLLNELYHPKPHK